MFYHFKLILKLDFWNLYFQTLFISTFVGFKIYNVIENMLEKNCVLFCVILLGGFEVMPCWKMCQFLHYALLAHADNTKLPL